MLVIDAAAVRELFPVRAAIEQMREALARYSAATVVQPLRLVVRSLEGPGLLGAMPAWAGADRGFGIKTVTIHPGNPARGLDTHQGTVTMFDRETGVPTAVLDAAAITEIRTGAVSAVATQALAAPEAGDLVIPIKAGDLGPDHLVAEIGEVLVGRHPGRTGSAEITLFKSLGLAIEDVMAGAYIEAQARARGLGTQAPLS